MLLGASPSGASIAHLPYNAHMPRTGFGEAPLMGWHFVTVRVASSFLFPVFAGWLVKLYYHE